MLYPLEDQTRPRMDPRLSFDVRLAQPHLVAGRIGTKLKGPTSSEARTRGDYNRDGEIATMGACLQEELQRCKTMD